MKILAIGDPHAKKNNTRVIKMLEQKILELIDREDPDLCVVLGDLANDFEKMHLPAWIAINEFLAALGEKVPTNYIVGNHDMVNNQVFLTGEHYFRFMNTPGVKIVDTVEVYKNMMFVPYVPPGRFAEAIKTSESAEGVKIIFCHQEFRGAKMGAIESRHGDIWPDKYPMVVSGHIHDRDLLQDNILYVGAPYQTSFGDNTNKTVEIIELSENGVESYRPVDLGMPKKINIRCDAEGFRKVQVNPGDDVRVLLKDTTENLKKIKKTTLYERLSKVCKIVAKPTDPAKSKQIASSKGFIKILEELIAEDSDKVRSVYKEVLSEVNP